jgi:hypothetical protein
MSRGGSAAANGSPTGHGIGMPYGQDNGWDIQPDSSWKLTEGRDPR